MNSDLMSSAGFDIYFHQRNRIAVKGSGSLCSVLGDRQFSVAVHHCHFLTVDRVSADLIDDLIAEFFGNSPHQRKISFLRGMFRKSRSQFEQGIWRFGYDQTAGGVFIQAVNDTGSAVDVLETLSETGVTSQQGVDDGSVWIAMTSMCSSSNKMG